MLKLNFTINYQRETNGVVPIYCSISCEQSRALVFSIGLTVPKAKWDTAGQKAKGNAEDAMVVNRELMNIRAKITDIYNNLLYNQKTISNKLLKNLFLGKEQTSKSFGNLIEASIKKSYQEFHNGKIAENTLKRHVVYHRHALMFLLHKKLEDISLKEINYGFIKEFHIWGANHEGYFYKTISKEFKTKLESWGIQLSEELNVKNKWGTNHLAKHLSVIKALFDEAVKMGEVKPQDHPFNKFEIEWDNTTVFKYLTVDELAIIEQAELDSERLCRVRDCFVFSCYTGLAYIDTKKLNSDWLSVDIKGATVIKSSRQKTNVGFTIPVLQPALTILEKYKDDPQCLYNEKLLPVLSNSKYNFYLKEIGAICKIEKNLTTHVARHTAATLLLRYGVPAETVGKVLGLSLKVLLSVYGDIVQDKIIEDMSIVDRRLLKEK